MMMNIEDREEYWNILMLLHYSDTLLDFLQITSYTYTHATKDYIDWVGRLR